MKRTWLLPALIAVFATVSGMADRPPAARAAGDDGVLVRRATADHKKFNQLKEPMQRGPDATRVCLSCHTEAAAQVQGSIHWTWGKKPEGEGAIGKAHILNSF
ncbi:MAG: hypothetical protein JW781_02275 [Deltaproteobacteria bacterium]|nr:hypothetical protein [Candidatus Anaeroferrophillacea bacterium]